MTTDRAEPQQPSLTLFERYVLCAGIHIARVEHDDALTDHLDGLHKQLTADERARAQAIVPYLDTCKFELQDASPAPDPAQEAAPVAGFAAGIKAAADWVRDRRFAWESENGYIEPDTGAMSFGSGAHANAKEEYDCELCEIEEGIRAIASPPAAPVVEDHEYACLRAVYEAARAYLRYEAEPDRMLEARMNLDNAIDNVKQGDGGYDYAAPVANGTEGQRDG